MCYSGTIWSQAGASQQRNGGRLHKNRFCWQWSPFDIPNSTLLNLGTQVGEESLRKWRSDADGGLDMSKLFSDDLSATWNRLSAVTYISCCFRAPIAGYRKHSFRLYFLPKAELKSYIPECLKFEIWGNREVLRDPKPARPLNFCIAYWFQAQALGNVLSQQTFNA